MAHSSLRSTWCEAHPPGSRPPPTGGGGGGGGGVDLCDGMLRTRIVFVAREEHTQRLQSLDAAGARVLRSEHQQHLRGRPRPRACVVARSVRGVADTGCGRLRRSICGCSCRAALRVGASKSSACLEGLGRGDGRAAVDLRPRLRRCKLHITIRAVSVARSLSATDSLAAHLRACTCCSASTLECRPRESNEAPGRWQL